MIKNILLILLITFVGAENGADGVYRYDENGRGIIPPKEELAKLPSDGGAYYNRLVFEHSPYLLQHAANPVDWFPWGEEAFAAAERLNKPIFLSIGYATCHWCHVMERESFENETIAALLNDTFVCIKVDREEHPDIDNVYMEITQMMTGRGGWPMTILMTPDKEPFYAATYIPSDTRGNRIGLNELIPRVRDEWRTNRESLLENAGEIVARLRQSNRTDFSGVEIADDIASTAVAAMEKRFDARAGGFGNAPKFPKAHDYSFLLQYWFRTHDAAALDMAEKSLQAMNQGGLYDQLGFGFHRYSTDQNWLVPHFEKMLYDQAILLLAYLDAYQATGKQLYARIAGEICTYVLRDLQSPEGGFYSAQDADSQGEEGLFYLWKTDEIMSLLGAEDARFIERVLNLKDSGNFPNEGYRNRTNIPHRTAAFTELAERAKLSEAEFSRRYERIRTRLFAAREKRVHPLTDDKILTDWNGLMIAALARAGRVLGNSRYEAAAVTAMQFLQTNLRAPDGGLYRRYHAGVSGLTGVLDDYAFVIWGLTELYETTFDLQYLRQAMALSDYQTAHFWDAENYGFFFSGDEGEALLVRTKEVYDGAVPSGNSVSAYNFLRLSRLTANSEYEQIASRTMEAFAVKLNRSPLAYTMMLQAVNIFQGSSFEVLVAGKTDGAATVKFVDRLQALYQPNMVTILVDQEDRALLKLLPFTANYTAAADGEPLVYVCQNYACKLPTDDMETVVRQLTGQP
ncbi:MAG: thioredoxin domain-containing protein [FCB group bacterium]|nr:thioredoxin domain-containing protein [FCB group bacterium]